MNPRLAKEIRPLMLPWLVAALAGGMMPVLRVMDRTTLPWASPFMAASFVFFGCVLLLAAMTFGVEFQQRTFQMLLSQPCERSRVWKVKAAVLGFALGLLALIQLVLQQIVIVSMPDIGAIPLKHSYELAPGLSLRTLLFPLEKNLLAGVFLLATVCSAGFWTLVARSTIGGMAFSFSAMYCTAVVVVSVLGRFSAPHVRFYDWPQVLVFAAVGMVYSGALLWLGWRKFAEMEIRDVPTSKSLTLPEWITFRKLAMPLRCQPTGNLRNLLRKEVCLQKPILTIAAVFAGCWFVALGLFALQPARAELWNGIFNGLTVVHVTIVVLLAGCVSLGEEKALGLAAWHLTLPVSVRRQWFVKLAVSAGVLVIVGVLLPWLLAWMISFKTTVGFAYLVADRERIGLFATLLVMAVGFILSFWSASHVENTVHAALAALLVCVAIIPTVMFANSLAADFGGLQTGLITWLIAQFQLPPDFFLRFPGWVALGTYFVMLAIVLMLLAQSLARFRRARQQGCVMFKSAIVLLTLVFAGTFWWADLAKSLQRQVGPFTQSLIKALVALPQAKAMMDSGQPWVVSVQELEQTGMLSAPAKVWLRNAQITYAPPQRPSQSSNGQARSRPTVTVHFPNGREYSWSW